MRREREVSRVAILGVALSLVVAGAIAMDSGVAAGCGRCGGAQGDGAASSGTCAGAEAGMGCCGESRGTGQGHGAGMKTRGGEGKAHHENIHALLDRHDAVERHVEEIEGGVETVTTSDVPEVTRKIREHVREMQQRMESGHGMRWWDPTFAELFRSHDEVEMQIEDIPGGVRVRETSEDPGVVMLIRQHAVHAVSGFVAEGHTRARQPTPLPDGYEAK